MHLQRVPPTNAAAVRADPLGKAVGEFVGDHLARNKGF